MWLLQSDGKIILVGTHSPTPAQIAIWEFLRLHSNGSPDIADFGTSGRTDIDFVLPGEVDFGISAALQSARIIVAGHSLRSAPANQDLTVAALSNDLILAHNFDGQQVPP